MSLASKRRPAALVEIIAAADLPQGAIPPETKLSDSFYRLSEYGLICCASGHARKAKSQERIRGIKENLADYHLNGEHALILLTMEQLAAASRSFNGLPLLANLNPRRFAVQTMVLCPTREQVGKITVTDQSAYVAVARNIAHDAVRKLSAGKVKGKTVNARALSGG